MQSMHESFECRMRNDPFLDQRWKPVSAPTMEPLYNSGVQGEELPVLTQQGHPKWAACRILPVPRERWEMWQQPPQFRLHKKILPAVAETGKIARGFFDSAGAEQRCFPRAVLSARTATPPGHSVKFISLKKVRNMGHLMTSYTVANPVKIK